MNGEWLDSLKEGDKVVYGHYRSPSIGTVLRRTKTHIIVQCGKVEQHYNSKNGYLIGLGKWESNNLSEVTPEIEQEIQRRNLLYWLEDKKWDSLSTEDLREIWTMVKGKKVLP